MDKVVKSKHILNFEKDLTECLGEKSELEFNGKGFNLIINGTTFRRFRDLVEIDNFIADIEEGIVEKPDLSTPIPEIIVPENWNKKANYEIEIIFDKIKVMGEKDEKVRTFLKSKGFYWDNGWYKTISEKNSFEDRIAEIGNTLLQMGWALSMPDSFKEKAIKGNFKKELFITNYTKQELKITWCGRNEMLYKAAMSLPRAKWRDGVIVNIAYFKEIYDFAELYDFNISDEAKLMLENFEKLVDNPIKISTKNSKKTKEKLEIILNQPNDVLEDLKDD